MSDAGQTPAEGGADVAALQRRIAELEAQNQQLQARVADQTFADELRRALGLAGAAATIAAPVPHGRLLEMIVETAAHVIKAQAASLFLIDHAAGELVFEVALGEKAEEVKKFRVPLGRGFAGLVAVTGQPMSISKVAEDPRWAGDIGREIQYVPQTMLCMPLRYGDDVIGVIQLLDKEGGQPFTPGDMETLGRFAEQAAVAIEQSRISRNLSSIFVSVLQTLRDGHEDPAVIEALARQATDFLDQTEATEVFRDALTLARHVQQIAGEGPAERKLASDVLTSVVGYLRERPRVDFSFS